MIRSICQVSFVTLVALQVIALLDSDSTLMVSGKSVVDSVLKEEKNLESHVATAKKIMHDGEMVYGQLKATGKDLEQPIRNFEAMIAQKKAAKAAKKRQKAEEKARKKAAKNKH